jgi:hypothetical protein
MFSVQEKKKIKYFIEKIDGLGVGPLTEMIVQLGKDLIKEIR